MSSRFSLLALLSLLMSLAYLDSRHGSPFGIDAVSAVTPGRVSVVGAVALEETDAALTAAQIDEVVRRAVYLSGGLHKAIDPGARWIVVRVADPRGAGAESGAAKAAHSYLAVIRAVVGLLHQAAGEARISLVVGSTPAVVSGPASGDTRPTREEKGRETALGELAADLVAAGIEVDIVDLATEETESVEVPDGGEAAAEYAVPIAILECDNIVNVAPYSRGGVSGLANLVGLAANDEAAAHEMARLVDLALLAETAYTVLGLLGTGGEDPSRPHFEAILAGHDPIAVDRISLEMTAADTSRLAALHLASSRRLGTVDLQWIKVNGVEVRGTWKESGRDSSAVE